jgi:hypothetical protein
MRRAAGAIASAPDRRAGGAARRADRLVDSEDNVGDAGLAAAMGEKIAAARAAHAFDEPALAQHGEELLEIGQ